MSVPIATISPSRTCTSATGWSSTPPPMVSTCPPRTTNSPRDGSPVGAPSPARQAVKPGNAAAAAPATWRNRLRRTSEPEETVDLDDQRAAGEVGNPARERVALLVVDDEQLAAGAVLPTQPDVGGDRVGGRAVL